MCSAGSFVSRRAKLRPAPRCLPHASTLSDQPVIAFSAALRTMASSSESPGAPSLKRNVAWALAGNLGYSACQWGVLVCIAKLGTAADVGRFALGLALTAPVITLTSLNLRLLQSTDARSDYPFNVYLSVRLIGTVLGVAAIAVMALALGYRGDLLYLVLVVAFAKAFEAASHGVFRLLQKAENLRRGLGSQHVEGRLRPVAARAA